MKQRAAEILFRYKVLILLPMLVILPLTMILASQPKDAEWQSFGVVWVDQYRPLYQDERLGYTPAASQAALLNDFLRTRTFTLNVAQQTQLAELLDGGANDEAIIHRIWESVRVYPTSNSFINVVVTMPDPDMAVEVAQATLNAFQEELRARQEQQSETATAVYTEAYQKAEEAVTKSRRELANYVTTRPELSRGTEGLNTSAVLRDPNFARLQAQVTYDEQRYNSALSNLEQHLGRARAGVEGAQFAFTVVDQPQRPLSPLPQSRLRLVKLPFIGLVLGLMLSSGIAALLILTNRSVHGAYDIRDRLGVPVLGEIPELRRKRIWQRASRDAVRLRIAGPAGTALTTTGKA